MKDNSYALLSLSIKIPRFQGGSKTHARKRSAIWSALAATLTPFASVHAQEATAAPADGDTAPSQGGAGAIDEEILVTALRKSERLQDVASTVVVTSGEDVEKAAITTLDQIGQVAPGVQLQAPSPGLFVATVRGLSGSPSNASFEQPVGLFIDGVFAGHPRDYTAALFDVESIELLKGTQAAVLGKSTSIGAISLNTRRPSPTRSLDLSYQHEFELGSNIFNGGADLPLTDTLSMRVAGTYSDVAGWIHYRLRGGYRPRTETIGLRGSLRWQPTDNIDWTVNAQYSRRRVDGQNVALAGDLRGNARATAALNGVPDLVIKFNSSDITPRPGTVFGMTDSDPFDRSNVQRYTSILYYYAGDYTIKSLTGYSKYKSDYLASFSGLPGSPFLRSQQEFNRSFSQELSVASPTDRSLSFIAGSYFYHDVWGFRQSNDYLDNPGFTGGGHLSNYYEQKIVSLSAFAQATYDLTDKLSLIGGLRYNIEDKTGFFTRDVIRPGGITRSLPPFDPTELKQSDDSMTYSAQAKYDLSRNLMVYVGYFTGYKAGGFQALPTNPATSPFNPERSRTLEVGTKFSFGKGGHINLALFNTDVKDYQFAITVGTQTVIRNDQIRSRGADLDIAIPLGDHLTLSQVVTYARVKKTVPVPGANDSLPWAPLWTGLSNLEFHHDINNRLGFEGNLGLQFRTKMFVQDSLSFPMQYSRGYGKLNASISITDRKLGIEYSLIGRNLSNERVINFASSSQLAGAYWVVSDPPRTIAVQIKFSR